MPKLEGALCEQCPLNARGKVVPSKVTELPHRFIIGEQPGEREAYKGEPFVGVSGQLLRRTIQQLGYDDTACNYTNIVACYTDDKLEKEEYDAAASCCSRRLERELHLYDGVPIIAMGMRAEKLLGITGRCRWEGNKIAVLHPAYILRETDEAPSFVHGLKKAFAPVHPLELPCTERMFIVGSIEDLPSLDEPRFKETHFIAVDVETDQVDWRDDAILLVGIGCQGYSWILTPDVVYSEKGILWLKRFFEKYKGKVGGHNFKFDLTFLSGQLGIPVYCAWDTLLMAHVLDENWSLNLKELATYYFDAPDYEGVMTKRYLKGKVDRYSKIPTDMLALYLHYDLTYTYMLAVKLSEELRLTGQYNRIYSWVYIPLTRELTYAEINGVCIDTAQVEQCKREYVKMRDASADKVRELTGGLVENPGSSQQCAHFVYDVLKAPPARIAKAGPRTTDEAALTAILDWHPAIPEILEYRRIAKLISSYLVNLQSYVRWDDGLGVYRVHPQFLQFGTVTGRLSARNPAIQTIPRPDTAEGRMVKDCIVAPPGYLLVGVDGSQWELRTAACASHDPVMLNMYNKENGDMHGEVASAMFGPNWTKGQRYDTKRFIFKWLFGGDARSATATTFNLPKEVMLQYAQRFTERFKVLVEWRQGLFDVAKQQGYLESRLGRRWHWYLITQQNMHEVRKATANYPIQGPSFDLIAMCMARSGDRIREMGGQIIITVHDSIIAEIPEPRAMEGAEIIRSELVKVATEVYPEVIWKAEVEVGTRWGSLKEVK